MRVALLTNIPAPYRVPVYDRMANALGRDFRAIYMAPLESDRKWNVPALAHDHEFLRGFSMRARDREIHVRLGVLRALHAFRPDVVMTGGFNPPMLAAWAYAQARGIAHVAISDGWLRSEASLSFAHRAVRQAVYRRSQAFVGASHKTLELFRRYGARENLFVAPLGVDNGAFAAAAGPLHERPFDLLFAGNLIPRKLPLFFAEVVDRVARRRGQVRVLVVGDGELRPALQHALARIDGASCELAGYLQQPELPAAYAKARILCFPTLNDPWGVVANEACASGMPVVTCDNAGCAGELVIHDQTGLVLPVDAEIWATRIASLLDSNDELAALGQNARAAVAGFSFDAASAAMLTSCRSAVCRD